MCLEDKPAGYVKIVSGHVQHMALPLVGSSLLLFLEQVVNGALTFLELRPRDPGNSSILRPRLVCRAVRMGARLSFIVHS